MEIIILLAFGVIALCVIVRQGRIRNLDPSKHEKRGLLVMPVKKH
jgi:hypothetical protein